MSSNAHFELDYGVTVAIMEDYNYPSLGRFNFNVNVTDVYSLWVKIKDNVIVIEELTLWDKQIHYYCFRW